MDFPPIQQFLQSSTQHSTDCNLYRSMSLSALYLHLQDVGSARKGKRVGVQSPPAPQRPQVPAGLDSNLQNFDDLEAARR